MGEERTNCGVGSITFGGVHHVLLQTVFKGGHKPTITLCGTDAPAHRDLFDDEWSFKDVYEAMEHVEKMSLPCKLCRRSEAKLRAVLKKE
jgi:hypothetical protein